MLSTVKKGLVAVGVLTAFSTSANASVDVSKVTLDVGSVEILAGVILGALALVWVARKVVSFLDSRGGYAWDSPEAMQSLEDYEYRMSEVH